MKKLKKWMHKNKINTTQLSYELKIPQCTIWTWLNNKSKPGIVNAIKVDKLTKGEVSVYDWA